MSKFTTGLNPQQKKAVLHSKGPLSIIAGAGSGKTRTLTHKLAHLIDVEKIDAYKILAVTFTNKAAKEMNARVKELIGPKSEGSTISTYHSLCVRILRQEIEFFGYPSRFNILDVPDQKQILYPIYRKYDLSPRTLSYSAMIAYISKNKMLLNEPHVLIETAEKDTDKFMAKVYGDYMEATRKSKSLDFDDLLVFVHKLFKENKVAAKKWSERFEYVLVDEFQDTSVIQYEIVKTLAKSKNITIVGDPDQTIYTWRYADASLIKKFKKDFTNTETIVLDQNYRSTKTILAAANKLIKHNKKREPKNLFSENAIGEPISFFHGFSDDSEAKWIAKQIKTLRGEGIKLNQIAVLYRANYISQSLERQFVNANVQYVIWGGVKFYQRQEIKDAIAFLKIIHNWDAIALNRMINVPARKIGAVALEKLKAHAAENKLSLSDNIQKNYKSLPLSDAQRGELGKFINFVNKYSAALKTNPISTVLQKFLIEIKYYNIFSSDESNKIDNVKQLVSSIDKWEKKNQDKELFEYLSEISLYTDGDNDVNDEFTYLMTIHSSKGLEFDYVFIAGFSEGVFPSSRSLEEPGGLEEERRLAYVAITRARKRVFISNSRGFAIDHKTQKKPSRFINELGIDIREHVSHYIAPKNVEENYHQEDNIIEEDKIIVGDKIKHGTFGTGKIISIDGAIAKIKFSKPHGVKSLMKNHKSIKKVVK